MALRNAQPVTFRAQGATDALDGSSTFEGAMAALTNLVPSPNQGSLLVPRVAAQQLSSFAGFSSPGVPNAILVVGDLVYGMVPSSRNAGKDEPFIYDMANSVFITLANVTAANCPTSPSVNGDWTPPMMAAMTEGRVMITHPGYDGLTTFVGWIDFRNFSIGTITGTTHSNKTIDTLSADPILAGVQVGDKITGAGIPANTYITAMTSTSLTISNNASASAAGVALTISSGTPAAPIYGAGNLNGNPLTSVPVSVALFSSRAWYAVSNFVVFSDTLNPTQVTAASQALRIGDSTPVTALGGVPLSAPLTGGTAQALIVFKGQGEYTQITGDAATSNLTTNTVAGSVGTFAPNTICPTPQGLAFVSVDGVRVISLDGVVKPAIGTKGRGISVPFSKAVFPSRMCAAYSQHVLRISVQNAFAGGSQMQEWWYDTERDTWTGPHTSACALIESYKGTLSIGNFVHVFTGVSAKLFASYSEPPAANISYTENGSAISIVWSTILTPDNQRGEMNCLGPQGTLTIQVPANSNYAILISDESNNPLDTTSIMGSTYAGSTWNSFNWGSGTWGYNYTPLQQVPLNFNQPNIFKQMQIRITGAAAGGLVIGDLHAWIQQLGYMIP